MVDSKKQLRKAAVAVRKEFKGKAHLDATIALTSELYEAYPILKAKRYDFAEIVRRGNKLRVLFV